MLAPTACHLQAFKHVLQYLKDTLYYGLFFKHDSSTHITTFFNSDRGGSRDDGRSTTTYILYMSFNIISWKFARQKFVSRFSTEVEYKALAHVVVEVIRV